MLWRIPNYIKITGFVMGLCWVKWVCDPKSGHPYHPSLWMNPALLWKDTVLLPGVWRPTSGEASAHQTAERGLLCWQTPVGSGPSISLSLGPLLLSLGWETAGPRTESPSPDCTSSQLCGMHNSLALIKDCFHRAKLLLIILSYPPTGNFFFHLLFRLKKKLPL